LLLIGLFLQHVPGVPPGTGRRTTWYP